MVDLVAERGYNAVTVTGLARRAGVSKRDFYRHFAGKEACFVATFDVIVRRSVRGILAAVEAEKDWAERLLLGFRAFADQIVDSPRAARLALVEAFDAGPKALKKMENADGLFEALIAKNLAVAPGGECVPPLVIKGIVAGGRRAARVRLLSGHADELELDGAALMEWALSFCDPAAARLHELGAQAPGLGTDRAGQVGPPERGNERNMILLAAARLAAREGFHELTVPRIRAAAGVSRKSFDQHFEGVTDCFLASVEYLSWPALVAATSAAAEESDWAPAIHRAMATLCGFIAGDPTLAKLAFLEIFSPGPAANGWRGAMTARLADLLLRDAPPDGRPTAFAAEASVAAVWGVMHHFVATGRGGRLESAAPTLSYLILAPGIGGAAACGAVEQVNRGVDPIPGE
jgi:AcrR family transcriptional regulator